MTWPTQLIRWILGAVMVYAGAVKALDPATFAASLARYHLFPSLLLAPLSIGLPWLEIACGGALLVNRLTMGAAALCTGLGVGFVTALSSAWWRNLDIDCGCFGGGDAATPGNLALALARAAGVLALALSGLILAVRRHRRETPPAAGPRN